MIAPDLIGFGLSEKPERQPDDVVEAHAQDLAVLLEILGVRDVQIVVAGTSAPIAAALARLEPDRVGETVLEDDSAAGNGLARGLARTPLVGELVVQGLGALSPGGPHGPLGRLQGSWDERASSLALARAALPSRRPAASGSRRSAGSAARSRTRPRAVRPSRSPAGGSARSPAAPVSREGTG